MQNKYCERSRITEKKFGEVLKYFSLDLEAQKISVLTGISEQTLTKYLRAIRVRLAKFRGIHKHTFYLHLKETEFRFNHRNHNMYQILLKIFRKSPLKLD